MCPSLAQAGHGHSSSQQSRGRQEVLMKARGGPLHYQCGWVKPGDFGFCHPGHGPCQQVAPQHSRGLSPGTGTGGSSRGAGHWCPLCRDQAWLWSSWRRACDLGPHWHMTGLVLCRGHLSKAGLAQGGGPCPLRLSPRRGHVALVPRSH